jgi:hypothetical protein
MKNENNSSSRKWLCIQVTYGRPQCRRRR